MNQIEVYVTRVMAVAGLPPGHRQAEELQAHLSDLAAEYQVKGLTADEATDNALVTFGTPENVGAQLREVTSLWLSRRDWGFLFAVALTATLTRLIFPGPDMQISVLVIGTAAAGLVRLPLTSLFAALGGHFVGGYLISISLWFRWMESYPLSYPGYGGGGWSRVTLCTIALAGTLGVLISFWRAQRRVTLGWGLVGRLMVFLTLGQAEFTFTTTPTYLGACLSVLVLQIAIVWRRWSRTSAGSSRALMLLAHFIPFLVVLDNQLSDVWEIVVFFLTVLTWYAEHRLWVPTLDWRRVAAGIAQALPLFVALGLAWGAVATLVSIVIWQQGRYHSTFVARHALQGACLSVAALLSQVFMYQLQLSDRVVPLLMVVGGSLSLLRIAFGLLAGWATLSALSGHDFRYPWAVLLLSGSGWRHYRST